MNDVPMKALEKRMESLERQNNWLTRLTTLLLVGIAGVVIMGQAQCNFPTTAGTKSAKVVEGQEFIVRDASGKPRVRITETGLTLTDGSGKERIYLGVFTAPSVDSTFANAAQLMLRNGDDSNRVVLASSPFFWGGADLKLIGPDGSQAYFSSGSKSGTDQRDLPPLLSLNDKGHRTTTELTPAHLGLWYNHTGEPGGHEPRIELDVDDSGSRLTLYDKERGMKPRAVLGSTSLTLFKTSTVEKRSESSLVLFDKDGKVIWQAPR